MRMTRTDIMGMPITIEIIDGAAEESAAAAFSYLAQVDSRFSTYRKDSEVSRINEGAIDESEYSDEMRDVLALAERTKRETNGYFDARRPDLPGRQARGSLDPSGIVKGWAVKHAAALLAERGHQHFMIEAAGDIALSGKNAEGGEWRIGIRNPFNHEEIVKVVYPRGKGVATSGSAARGAHIYDPHAPERPLDEIVSITVIGPDVLEADRYATAAFAMQRNGAAFIEKLPGFAAYAIDRDGIATMTSGFPSYTKP